MTNGQRVTFILFYLLLNACGQQGPLFMPIENPQIEDNPVKNTKQDTETQ